MSPPHRRVQFPDIMRATRYTPNPTIQVAPEVFAIDHSSEQQFFISQASHMEMLADSAGVKSQYHIETKRLKKDLRIALSEVKGTKATINAVVSRMTDGNTKDTIPLEEKDSANELQNTALEQPKEEKRNISVDLQKRICDLEGSLNPVAERCDDTRSDTESAKSALADVTTQYIKCYEDLETLKLREHVLQEAIEESSGTESDEQSMGDLHSELKKAQDALKIKEVEHWITCRTLHEASTATISAQNAFMTKNAELKTLTEEYEKLLEDYGVQHEDLETMETARDQVTQSHTHMAYKVSEKEKQLEETNQKLCDALHKISQLEGAQNALEDTGKALKASIPTASTMI
ncbi:hypothetical protein CC86DRAFT_417247 [Ophiobolus disseminans]|uniref:Uncharacterized protein n=1 Tax=Ophiobolus disseminans TaxID=1469910 RepID=A0A6A7A0B9_9PLEO|nr:hypothetical protein CC86DRAFT_417247 [Ophiobolus disseminans]